MAGCTAAEVLLVTLLANAEIEQSIWCDRGGLTILVEVKGIF